MYLIPAATLVSSFILCFYTIPVLIKLANRFNIYDQPGFIKNHDRKISFFGGAALFTAFVIPLSLLLPESTPKPPYLIAYLILLAIIFLHGLGDDLFNYSPMYKFSFQGVLISLLIYKTGLYLPVETMFDNYTLPAGLSFALTLLGCMSIVNAFNLIDGSDGLAGGLALVGSLFYSIYFLLSGNLFLALTAIAVTGSLLAFLLYNKPPAHIFMGDSGSLFIGMLLATLTIFFVAPVGNERLALTVNNRIVLGFSLLSVPVLDMVRMFFLRAANGQNPFKGDNQHIHHLMKEIGFTSKQTVLILVTFQILMVGIAFLAINSSWLGFILVNLCLYIFLVQLLRQLKTYFSRKRSGQESLSVQNVSSDERISKSI
jgi:UDP-N-acetylmuramyl pentapeptide phosphotransferase/UDP-N-acetylglucosamine-1-phosphate transferase